jgi:hypothetical protein
LTTTLWPAISVRRWAPSHERVIAAVTPVLPTTTASPLTTEAAAITGTVGTRPIAAQQMPVRHHAPAMAGSTGTRLSRRITPRVPRSEPAPYAVMPTASRFPPRPCEAPRRARPRVNPNHRAHPVPRTTQPASTLGCPTTVRQMPSTLSGSRATPVRPTPPASAADSTIETTSAQSSGTARPRATRKPPAAGPAIMLARRKKSRVVNHTRARSGPT